MDLASLVHRVVVHLSVSASTGSLQEEANGRDTNHHSCSYHRMTQTRRRTGTEMGLGLEMGMGMEVWMLLRSLPSLMLHHSRSGGGVQVPLLMKGMKMKMKMKMKM